MKWGTLSVKDGEIHPLSLHTLFFFYYYLALIVPIIDSFLQIFPFDFPYFPSSI